MKNTKLSHSVFVIHSRSVQCALYCVLCIYFSKFKVLAHRGSHWSILQRVCQTVWDHSCRITILGGQLEPPCPVTADQLHDTFTSLLVLSVDLIMDMLS